MGHEREALGLVRSGVLQIDRSGRIWRTLPNGVKVRADHDLGRGWRVVRFRSGGVLRSVRAHRLVWWAKKGPIGDGLQINHKDGNRGNNRVTNLEPVDQSANILHSYRKLDRTLPWTNATVWRGKPIVTDDKVRSLARARASGKTLAQVASAHGLSVSHTHRLLSR